MDNKVLPEMFDNDPSIYIVILWESSFLNES